MSDYTPKVGDKVRATLGENVFVGKVVSLAEGDWADIEFTDTNTIACFFADGWRFERIQELPTKRFALIGHPSDRDFHAYLLDAEGKWWLVRNDDRNLPVPIGEVQNWIDNAGFSVLFEGVDE